MSGRGAAAILAPVALSTEEGPASIIARLKAGGRLAQGDAWLNP